MCVEKDETDLTHRQLDAAGIPGIFVVESRSFHAVSGPHGVSVEQMPADRAAQLGEGH